MSIAMQRHKKNAYFSGDEHISRRYLGNKELKHVSATTNTLQQGVCYSLRETPIKRADFDSQEQFVVSIRREPSAFSS
jgi:hypothetical protein